MPSISDANFTGTKASMFDVHVSMLGIYGQTGLEKHMHPHFSFICEQSISIMVYSVCLLGRFFDQKLLID